jgi:hypothetical protein
MGGAITLLPSSPFHVPLKSTITAQFQNEYFNPDAAKMLANTADYVPRSAILNRNAMALATFLHEHSKSPTSPVTAVLYPPFTNTHANYTAMMRPATKDFTPGYGCLLAIEFTTLRVAQAFYDNLSVFQGPHLGARTSALSSLPPFLFPHSRFPLLDPSRKLIHPANRLHYQVDTPLSYLLTPSSLSSPSSPSSPHHLPPHRPHPILTLLNPPPPSPGNTLLTITPFPTPPPLQPNPLNRELT